MSLKEKCRGISLGLFAGDLLDLRHAAQTAEHWGCGIFHFDVMDGCFVPQLTAGAGFIRPGSDQSLCDVHLMVERPAQHVASFITAGADIVVVHAEAEGSADALSAIRQAAAAVDRQVIAGVALMPETTLAAAADILNLSPDLILVLALDPREGSAADIARACARVADLRRRYPDSLISFDGGVTMQTLPEIVAAGPDLVVSGSAILRAPDPQKAFADMNRIFGQA